MKQLRHVRSIHDVKLWWRQWKHSTWEREIQRNPHRWEEFIRNESNYELDKTVRASGAASGRSTAAPSTPLRSLFCPTASFTTGKKIHPSTSDGHLIESPAKMSRFSTRETPTTQSSSNSSEEDGFEGEFRPESDHDRFERAWQHHIRFAEYKRLVLPPECRLVESSLQNDLHKSLLLDESSPWHKTVAYFQNLYGIWTKLFSVEGAKDLLLWMMHVFRYKIRKQRGLPVDEDDDDDEDDDGSVATLGSGTRNWFKMQSPKRNSHGNAKANGAKRDKDDTPPLVKENGTAQSGTAHMNENDSSSINIPSLKTAEKEAKNNLSALPLHPRQHLGSVDTVDDASFVSATGLDLSERKDPQSANDLGIPTTVVSRPKKSKSISPIPVNLFTKSNGAKKKDALGSYRKPAMAPTTLFNNNNNGKILLPAETSLDRVTPMNSPKVKPHSDLSEEVPSMNFFDTANSDSQLRDMSRAVPIPDSNGYILGDEFLSPSCTPLLVFVNSKSGPQQGNLLITQFRRLLNPIQVWDLGKGGPEKVLKSFSVLSRFQILVCGGDGTVSWIISALEKMDLKRWPPIGILPLGTGNDLARVHGWGGGYNNESLLFILRQISEAYVSMLDLWELDITDKKGRRKDTKSFINYLGVGVDAQAALQVHNLRESKPKLFFSRFYNKVWYAIAGGEEAIKSSCANISQQIVLVADGVEIPLPPDSQGIIFLNIDSYSGGVPMWSKGQKPKRKRMRRHSEGDSSKLNGMKFFSRSDSIEDFLALETEASKEMSPEARVAKVTACDLPSSCQDGLLDVVSIRGTFHLGQIRVGLSNAQLLCQCREAVVTLKKKVAVQIDGEPWRQNQSVLRINRKKDRATMLNRSADDNGGVESEVAKLLSWANEREVIDRNQYAT